MGLSDRDYMRPDYRARPRAGIWSRLRFLLWRLMRAVGLTPRR